MNDPHEEEIESAAAEATEFSIALRDLPNNVDALFVGGPDGWVTATVNAVGQRAVEAVFPTAYIEWRDVLTVPPGILPDDWREFTMNVPDVAASTGLNNLPEHLLNLADLDEATPDALAFLMTIAARNQGARAAMILEDGYIDIYPPMNMTN
jgi:hypothetical protein